MLDLIDKKFLSKAFFGISSLGDSPSMGKIMQISPFRIEEPLLWILWKLKYIGSRKEKRRYNKKGNGIRNLISPKLMTQRKERTNQRKKTLR
jgi:hypothetical protein